MSESRTRLGSRTWRSAWSLAALLYAVTLGVSPLLHHDISCELKSRTHCTTCVSGASGPGLAEPATPPAHGLSRAGSVAADRDVAVVVPCVRPFGGRSPPSA